MTKIIYFLAKNSRATMVMSIFILLFVVDKGLGIHNFWIRLVIIIPFAFLMPRRKLIETNEGEKIEVSWVLLKEPIIIDK